MQNRREMKKLTNQITIEFSQKELKLIYSLMEAEHLRSIMSPHKEDDNELRLSSAITSKVANVLSCR
jgi:hypothetical protein